ncbi:MAG: hypothetical protein PHR47_02570 [Candidatus Pacebacteria bacterium]|nr:hypothetical protein [Candidatus Paceibacterota bacterium]
MTKKIVVRTGEKVPVSGQYRPSGGRTESTFTKGDPATPNNIGKRQFWTLVDKTKHKR